MSDSTTIDTSQFDRILQRTIHEENVYYARLNFFLVFESVLLASFVSLEKAAATWFFLAWAIPVLGIVISGLWWRAQARQYRLVHDLGERVTNELPEYQGASERRAPSVSPTRLMTHGVPLLFLSLWFIVALVLACQMA